MERFSDLQGLIIDMDGVLWRGGVPLPGIREAFARFRELQIPLVLATNNATQTFERVQARMAEARIAIESDEVLTAAAGTARFLVQHVEPGSAVYAIGDTALREALIEAGYSVQASGEDVAAVVVGIDWALTWDKLAEATYALRDGALFLGTNPDVSFPTERGIAPGNGATLAALQAATGREPLIFGKPEPHLYAAALELMGTEPARTVAVGDRLETDILGGQRAGMPTALVLTGVTSAKQVSGSEIKPDWVFEGLVELSQALEN